MAGISPELAQELRRAVKRALPTGFADAIADALHCRNTGEHERKQEDAHFRETVEAVFTAGVALQAAIARADAVFGVPAWRTTHWTLDVPGKPPQEIRPISDCWQRVSEALDGLIGELKAWLSHPQHRPWISRRGPHGRSRLRFLTFEAVAAAGVLINKNAQGPAAHVLRVVLAEADRLDGKPIRDRAYFNGTQWSEWVDAHVKAVEHFESWRAIFKTCGSTAGFSAPLRCWLSEHDPSFKAFAATYLKEPRPLGK